MAIFMIVRLRKLGLCALASHISTYLGVQLLTGALWVGTALYVLWYLYLLRMTLKAATWMALGASINRIVVAGEMPFQDWFSVDGAPEEIAKHRIEALKDLKARWAARFPKQLEMGLFLRKHFSDLRFCARTTSQTFASFQNMINDDLDPCCFMERCVGRELIDIDGNHNLDCSGSHGVNLWGHTLCNEFMQAGHKIQQDCGGSLGPLHPIVVDNIKMLTKHYNKDEVSFHMSGTEAVMCATQQCRFYTQKPLIVVFNNNYHGWWDGVMQGVGHERLHEDYLMLQDMSPASLDVIALRKDEIAGVLVDPLMGSGWDRSRFWRTEPGEQTYEVYRLFLRQVRDTCTKCNIPLIVDECWSHHIGPEGAQRNYGIEADLIVLGKPVAGSAPIGIVCGTSKLMDRLDPHKPARFSLVIGTFSAHPQVMGSLNACLKYATSPEAGTSFKNLFALVEKWVVSCNAALQKEVPFVRVHANRAVWLVTFEKTTPYEFLFGYYLREAGLQLAWLGHRRMLFNLEFTQADFDRLTGIILQAARAYKKDGWYWEGCQPMKMDRYILRPTLNYHLSNLKSYIGL